jgi:hypothetical protein
VDDVLKSADAAGQAIDAGDHNGHSFSGMIVTDAGVHPNVSALVYVAARAPDAG